ncbi:MAG TPA: ATP-binding cassette domain-containing protein [Caldimonas sp.]|nr:ATP-binding cassette domain-containing protein [Caldimonas sp.]
MTSAAPAAPVVALRGVRVRYRRRGAFARGSIDAVRGVDLEIASGETLGLVGESGSGKSTLARVALGLLQPAAGEALLDGAPLTGRDPRGGALAVVFQHPEWALNPRLRCSTSVLEPLAVRKVDAGARRERLQAILSDVGLDPALADRYPGELSGGQRQRMAIARALVTRPRFVVFDEAVSALDVSVQSQILNLIRRLQDEHRFAALFISHDLAATRYVAHRIAVMREGALVEVAPAAAFYGEPAHPYSRALRASIEA